MSRDWKATVIKCVTMLAESFGRQASEAMVGGYCLGLKGLSIEQVGVGTERALATCRFMPSPAELRELAGEMRLIERAIHAWSAFASAVVKHTSYRTVDFDDKIINATVRNVGGWPFCCQMETREFDTFLRERFLKTYVSLAASGVGEDQAAPLVGTFDSENYVAGYLDAIHEPLRVATGLPELPTAPRIASAKRAVDVPRLVLKSSRDA